MTNKWYRIMVNLAERVGFEPTPLRHYLNYLNILHPYHFKNHKTLTKTLIITLTVLLFAGCAHRPDMKPVCRHWAVFTAITYQDYTGCPVRIAIGPVYNNPTFGHAQAQAFVNQEWKWLVFKNGEPQIGEQDPFVPVQYHSVQEFMSRKNAWKNHIFAKKL